MDAIGIDEVRTRFAEWLADVEKGRRIMITRHGKPIAMLSPVLGADPTRTQVVIDRMRITHNGRRLGGDISDFRSQGRRWIGRLAYDAIV